ncbi:MAG: NADH-quinone oxidoreductase subunit M [Acidobacteriota bacterium]|nr:MAG: NADH-quinone oxidoreductase subunit M [Acidobacteriota bacterium]
MFMDHILTWTTFLPLIGAALIAFLVPGTKHRLIRVLATVFVVADFALALLIWRGFSPDYAGMQFVKRAPWIPAIGVEYHVGIDGVSLLLILLTTLLGILAVTCSYTAITERVKEYYVMLLFLQTSMLGVFIALDLFLFYVFWEVMLVPMYFLIGVWGSDNKLYSAIKFFLYTLFGSVFLLVGILALYFVNTTGIPMFGIEGLGNAPSLNILHLQGIAAQIPATLQFWVFFGMFLGFAIKVPMFPFHTWLPDAHTDAPTAGSVILAAVLLKMGTYGFFRVGMPVLPLGFEAWKELLIALCLIAIIYGALVCLVQRDMKRLVAFSSVSHMGYVMLGIFVLNEVGMKGGLLQMINHGITTGALFMLVGIIYERRHTRLIRDYGGLAQVMPVYAAIFLVMALASMGLPGLNGFIGEFLVIIGAYQENFWWAFTAAVGVILAAAYLLWLYQRVFFGPLENEKNKSLRDCSAREAWQFAPLIVLSLWIGLYPKPFLNYLEKPVEQLILHMEEARAFGEGEERLVQAGPPAPPEPAVVAEEISLEPESLPR